MKQAYYENEWQGLILSEIGGRSDAPAGIRFYRDFYDRLHGGDGRIAREGSVARSDWIAQKRNVGLRMTETLGRHGLTPMTRQRVLAVGAGSAFAEEVLLEAGYTVDCFDCQTTSLQAFRTRRAATALLVGDVERLPVAASAYGGVTCVAVEYALDDSGYARMMREIARVLVPGGILTLVSASNLAARDLLAAWPGRLKRQASSSRSKGRPVMWGYRRSVDGHVRCATAAGLDVLELIGLTRSGEVVWTRKPRTLDRFIGFTSSTQLLLACIRPFHQSRR